MRIRRTFTLSVVVAALTVAGLPLLTGAAQAAPTAPGNVVASNPGNGTVDLSWDEAVFGGDGTTITNYNVVPSPACNTCSGLSTDGSTLNTTVGGLTNGVSYTFTVVATDDESDTTDNTAESGSSNAV